MRVLELARRRKTVREFLPDRPPKEDILKAIEAAKEAPSGMNAQPWRFVIIDDDWMKGKIRGGALRERGGEVLLQNAGGRPDGLAEREGLQA